MNARLLILTCVAALAAFNAAAQGVQALTPLSRQEIQTTVEGRLLSISAPGRDKTHAFESYCPGGAWRASTSRLSLTGVYSAWDGILCVEHGGARLRRRVLRDTDGRLYLQAMTPNAPIFPVFSEPGARCKD